MPKVSKKVSTRVKSEKNKSPESWIWDAACSIRGAKDAPKYKDFILPLIFTKRLRDVFDDELNRIAADVGSRKNAFQLAKRDHKLVRFFLRLEPADPEQPDWSVTFGSGGLLIKCEIAMEEAAKGKKRHRPAQALRPGIYRRHLGHGVHEHDHPRHGGLHRDRRYLQDSEGPGQARQAPPQSRLV